MEVSLRSQAGLKTSNPLGVMNEPPFSLILLPHLKMYSK